MSKNKYQREIKPGVFVDVYDVLKAFNVVCPAMAHGVKKCLAPGQRGVQDKNEAIASIKRSIEMEGEAPVGPDKDKMAREVLERNGAEDPFLKVFEKCWGPSSTGVRCCGYCVHAYPTLEGECPHCRHVNTLGDKAARDVWLGVFEGEDLFASPEVKKALDYMQDTIRTLRSRNS